MTITIIIQCMFSVHLFAKGRALYPLRGKNKETLGNIMSHTSHSFQKTELSIFLRRIITITDVNSRQKVLIWIL